MCVYQVWAVPKEARSECLIIWDWDSRQLWATLWILGIELRSSGRSTSALKHWSVSSTSSQLALNSAFHRSFLGSSYTMKSLLAFYPISVHSLNFLHKSFPEATLTYLVSGDPSFGIIFLSHFSLVVTKCPTETNYRRKRWFGLVGSVFQVRKTWLGS